MPASPACIRDLCASCRACVVATFLPGVVDDAKAAALCVVYGDDALQGSFQCSLGDVGGALWPPELQILKRADSTDDGQGRRRHARWRRRHAVLGHGGRWRNASKDVAGLKERVCDRVAGLLCRHLQDGGHELELVRHHWLRRLGRRLLAGRPDMW